MLMIQAKAYALYAAARDRLAREELLLRYLNTEAFLNSHQPDRERY